MTDRAALRRAFVDATAWRGGLIQPLAADASFRSYHRVTGAASRPSAVLMDAPPPKEDVRPFIAVTHYLRGIGLSAPDIHAADPESGFLLLEDLGDARMGPHLAAAPGDERALYEKAVAILAHIHAHAPPARLPVADGLPYDLPAYDAARLMEEALLLPHWFIPAATGQTPDDAAMEDYRGLWAPLLREAAAGSGMVLRDYHADNLMVLAGRPGLGALGLLDYQDAVIGPPAYDLVSLLEDARRDVPPALAGAMLGHYLDVAGMADRAGFTRLYDILGAQRNAKIIGIFARLSRRDGKHHYLTLIPRVWRLLDADLDRLGAPGLTAWLKAHAPDAGRRRPLPPA